jgi:hypothetical protein
MQKFILPTADLVDRFKDYEYFLVFYEDGIRGLIRDLVQRQAGYLQYEQELTNTKELFDFVDRRIFLYDNSPEAICSQYNENINWNGILIVLIETLDTLIKETLLGFFNKSNYIICKHSYEWVGNDLVISFITKTNHVKKFNNRFIK